MSLSTLIWSIPDRLVSVISKVALVWTANRRPIIIGTLFATLGAGSLAFLYVSQKKIPAGASTSHILSEETPTHNYQDTSHPDEDVISQENVKKTESEKVECASSEAIVPVPNQSITPYSISNESIVAAMELSRSSISSPSTEFFSMQDSASVATSTFNDASFYTAPTNASTQSLGGITTEDEMLPEADEFDRATPEPGQESSKKEDSSFLSSSLSEDVVSETIYNISDLPPDSVGEKEVQIMRGYLLNLYDVIVNNPQSPKDKTAFHLWSRVVTWLFRITSDFPQATRLLHDAGISEDSSTQFIAICKDVNHEMTTLMSESVMANFIRTLSALTQYHLLNQSEASTKSVSGPEATSWMLLKATMNQVWQTILLPLDQLPIESPSESTVNQEPQVIAMSLGWNTGREIQSSALQFISGIIACVVGSKTRPVTPTFRDLLLSVALPSQQKNIRCLLSLALPRPESQPDGFTETEDAQEGRNELRSVALKCLIHLSQPLVFESNAMQADQVTNDNAANDDIAVTHKGPLMILNVKNMPSSISILLKRALLVHPHESQYSLHEGWLKLLANLLHCVVACIEAKRGDLLTQKDPDVDRNREGDSESIESLRPFRSFFSALFYTRQDLQASAALLVTRGESLEVRKLAADIVGLLESISSLC